MKYEHLKKEAKILAAVAAFVTGVTATQAETILGTEGCVSSTNSGFPRLDSVLTIADYEAPPGQFVSEVQFMGVYTQMLSRTGQARSEVWLDVNGVRASGLRAVVALPEGTTKVHVTLATACSAFGLFTGTTATVSGGIAIRP